MLQAIFQLQEDLYKFIGSKFYNDRIDSKLDNQDQVKESGWNIYEQYERTLKNDMLKNKLAKENNIPLVRIPYWERDNITLDLLLGNKYLIS